MSLYTNITGYGNRNIGNGNRIVMPRPGFLSRSSFFQVFHGVLSRERAVDHEGRRPLEEAPQHEGYIYIFLNKDKNYYVCYLPWMCTIVVCITENMHYLEPHDNFWFSLI